MTRARLSNYTLESRALRETGVITVRACVGTNGFLTAAPTVDRSSGSPRLDASALKLALAGSGHFAPATLDGVPVESCFLFKITFGMTRRPDANGRP
jgi:TonB family protein